MIILLSPIYGMYSTNVGFLQVVQLFAHPQTQMTRAENSFYKFTKNFFGWQQCAQKY